MVIARAYVSKYLGVFPGSWHWRAYCNSVPYLAGEKRELSWLVRQRRSRHFGGIL